MTPSPLPAPQTGLCPPIVLDTNVVLDWLLFRNPQCGALAAALEAGRLRWLATAAMQDEFFHVLDRGSLDAWRPDRASLQAAWAVHHRRVAAPTLTPCRPDLRCSDADDQKFIDLAAATGGCWLLSRDRAVRRLRRPLQRWGVKVGTPEEWTLDRGVGGVRADAQTTCCDSSPEA